MPFVQGITSAHDIGGIVSKAIISHIDASEGRSLLQPDPTPLDAA